MNKRTYFPNHTIRDERLPFDIEITNGLTAYVRDEKGQLRRAVTTILKKQGWIIVEFGGYKITIKAWKDPVYGLKTCSCEDKEKCSHPKPLFSPGHFVYDIENESEVEV